MLKLDKKEFIKVCSEEPTMARAAVKLGLHFNTFKKYALKYNCYNPNQSGKGTKKNFRRRITRIEDYATRASVRKVILRNNLLPYNCSECGIEEWNGKKLSLHLDHINGKNGDHRLDNLRFLCPNCHSQSSTYAGRNKQYL